jgi:membrane protein
MSLKQGSAQSEHAAGHTGLRRWFQLLLDTVNAFWADDCYTKAGALAYYAVLSVLPLLIVLILAASAVGQRLVPGLDVATALLDFIERFTSPQIAAWIQQTLSSLEQQTTLLSGINLLIVIWSAANIFRQLNVSISTIWKVYEQTETSSNVFSMAKWYAHDQFRSFLLLLTVLGLFFLDQIVRLVLFVLREYVSALPIAARWSGEFGTPLVDVSVFVLDVLWLALLYRYFPPVRVPWRAVIPGAVLSAILIVVAGFALGLIFSGMFAGIYAALGGPIALMLWVNLVGQSVLLGCELTRQYWLMADGQRTIAAISGTAA